MLFLESTVIFNLHSGLKQPGRIPSGLPITGPAASRGAIEPRPVGASQPLAPTLARIWLALYMDVQNLGHHVSLAAEYSALRRREKRRQP
jgi:hypothetical protein